MSANTLQTILQDETGTLSSALDLFGPPQGSVLYRDAAVWKTLNPGLSGQVLTSGGAGANPSWAPAGGTGTVTSVGATVPSFMSVSGSPITISGTLGFSFNNQNANLILAGPTSGAPATPAFRSLVAADIPAISLSSGVTGILPIANGGTNAGDVGTARLNFTLPVYVSSRAALQALDTTKDVLAYQIGAGMFAWTTGNFTTQSAADTNGAIYVKANAIAISSGAWVLQAAGQFTLIGQGVSTYVNYLSYPSAIGGRHYAIAGQMSAGTAAAGDKVGVYGAAETGSSGNSDVWASNFLAQWNTGDPDVNVQAVEIDFNNRSGTDAAHNPAKLKVGINVTSGGTNIPGYAYYVDASNKPTNAWRQGLLINDGAVLDTGVNVGMNTFSGVYCGRQIVDGGDGLLLQRRTDTSPTGFLMRLINFANTANLWMVAVDGSTSVGPRLASTTGSRLHVSEPDNTNTTELLALGLEGDSSANSIGKIVSANFYGRDTVNTRKQTVALKSIPIDSNWVTSALGFFVRTSDAVAENFRVTGSGFGYPTGNGGTVTQATSKSTGVTLNKVCGQITMNAAALAASTTVNFVLTNSTIAATDLLVLNHVSGGTAGSYTLNAQAAAGSATINVRNVSLGSLSEAIVIGFAVVKAVTA